MFGPFNVTVKLQSVNLRGVEFDLKRGLMRPSLSPWAPIDGLYDFIPDGMEVTAY